MSRYRSKRPVPETTTRVLRPCSTPDCRRALMDGDSDGDLCGKCSRTRARRAAAGATTNPIHPPTTRNATA